MLAERWAALVMGWPAIGLVVLATALGFAWRRPAAVMVGTVLMLPFAAYLAMTPRFRLLGPALPLFHLASAWALRRGHRVLASLLVAPFAIVVVVLARAVLSQ